MLVVVLGRGGALNLPQFRHLPLYLYLVKLLCWLWSWEEGLP